MDSVESLVIFEAPAHAVLCVVVLLPNEDGQVGRLVVNLATKKRVEFDKHPTGRPHYSEHDPPPYCSIWSSIGGAAGGMLYILPFF